MGFVLWEGSQTVGKWINKYVIIDRDEQHEESKCRAVMYHTSIWEPPPIGCSGEDFLRR